jgi:hypothetical protein
MSNKLLPKTVAFLRYTLQEIRQDREAKEITDHLPTQHGATKMPVACQVIKAET